MYDHLGKRKKGLALLFAEVVTGAALVEGFFGARNFPLGLVLRLGQPSEFSNDV